MPTPGDEILPAAPAPDDLEPHPYPLVFTGKGSEYFGIWIVNLMLSLLTLGIYSAWAKVRRLQYFSRNTQLAGASFDYHGNPVSILKGRLIALGMLLLYNLASLAHPYFGLAVATGLLFLLPNLLLKSLQFRLHNTSYRGLRFRFQGSRKDAYTTFLLLPVASLLTLYLLAPLCHQRIKRFQHNNSAFGQSTFSFHAPARAFYWLYLQVLGLFLACATLTVLATSLMFGNVFAAKGTDIFFFMSLLPFALMLTALFFIRPFMDARLQNLVWNHTRLGRIRFCSTVMARRLFFIMATNLLGVLLTLGLYRPFAVARLHKYRAESVTLLASGDLDDFVAASGSEVNAAGDEAAEMFDIDIAL